LLLELKVDGNQIVAAFIGGERRGNLDEIVIGTVYVCCRGVDLNHPYCALVDRIAVFRSPIPRIPEDACLEGCTGGA